jgi:hypothetical protein
VSQSVKLLIRAVALLVLSVWLGVTYVHYAQLVVMLASVALLVMAANDVVVIRRERPHSQPNG